MDSLEQIAKLIKQQADSMENVVVEHISSLYAERRRARKLYQEEQAWLTTQFQQVAFYATPFRDTFIVYLVDTTQSHWPPVIQLLFYFQWFQ